ncbi:MAG: hypothetical protein ITG02_04415 [Patulibacter sp.]|nr:hypothetical protein [Patulibacter sp.]
MLFDLRAPGRKRMIQAIYLVLAVVLVGGTVLFGVGTGLPGLFGSGNNTSTVDLEKQQADRIAQVERQLAANPEDQQALITLASLQYSQAMAKMPENATETSPEVNAGLRRVAATWDRYVETDPKKVDPALANKMVGVFGPSALNQPNNWADVQGLLTQQAADEAEARNEDPPINVYLQLLAAQTAAERTRQAKLTEERIKELTPKGQEKQVRDAIASAKDPNAQTAGVDDGQGQAGETITVPED